MNIGIFVSNEQLLKRIHWFGSYRVRGDIISVQGIFHRNCSQHYERDIHDNNLKVIRSGGVLKENIPLKKWVIFVILAIINLFLVGIYLIKEKRWKRLKS